jgi:HEAT repeat protein
MGYGPAVEAVLGAMQPGEDPAVRISMIRAAAFCVEHGCFETVLAATGDADPDVRKEAAVALGRFTRQDEVDAMTALIERQDTAAARRQLLFAALGDGVAVRAVPVLLAGLKDSDEASRGAAWTALRKISGRQLPLDPAQWEQWWAANSHRTREDILEEHLQALSREAAVLTEQMNDLTSQQAELMKLVSSSQPETPKLLLEALTSRHSSVRQYSACRLAALSKESLTGLKLDAKDSAALEGALADPSPQVRGNVLRFAVQSEADCRDRMVRKALGDEDPAILTTAIEAVRVNPGPEAVDRLEVLVIESRSKEVREAAANALGKVGSDKSALALITALDDREENVRWFAVEGLRKLHAVQALPKISEMLQTDASARVREIAASTLGELGQPAGVPALNDALDDRNDRVREKAISALLALATGNCDRMLVIATTFQERRLYEQAEQVLTRTVEQYGSAPELKGRLPATYEQLAAVQKARSEFGAAAKTYEKLDELSGGSAKVRRELVNCWVQSGDVTPVVGAVEKWLAAAGQDQRPGVMDLALDCAERLQESGHAREAGAVVDAVVKAAGQTPEAKLTARMEKLRRKIGG